MSDDEAPDLGFDESSDLPADVTGAPANGEAGSEVVGADDLGDSSEVDGRSTSRRIRALASNPVRLAIVVGVASAVALTGLCGLLGYRAYEARQQQQLRQLLLQVGRQGAVNLTTIDYEHADADVKRILDSATGQFYDEFNTRSTPFIDVVKKMQSKSVGTVTKAGTESVSGQEGQVLVAVSVKTTTRGNPDDQPRYWRMRLTVSKQGADAKVSKVEFVP